MESLSVTVVEGQWYVRRTCTFILVDNVQDITTYLIESLAPKLRMSELLVGGGRYSYQNLEGYAEHVQVVNVARHTSIVVSLNGCRPNLGALSSPCLGKQ